MFRPQHPQKKKKSFLLIPQFLLWLDVFSERSFFWNSWNMATKCMFFFFIPWDRETTQGNHAKQAHIVSCVIFFFLMMKYNLIWFLVHGLLNLCMLNMNIFFIKKVQDIRISNHIDGVQEKRNNLFDAVS